MTTKEFTDEQLRQKQADAQKRAGGVQTGAKLIGAQLQGVMRNNMQTKTHVDTEKKCVICGCGIGAGPYKSGKTCDKSQCQWASKTGKEKIGIAMKAGVGELFIRDRRLPMFETYAQAGDYDPLASMYVCGPVGTGKTWLLNCVVCEALAVGHTALIETWQWYQLLIRSTYHSNAAQTELGVVRSFLVPDVLCIDDIGSGKDVQGRESEAARINLHTILDKRYAAKKPTHFSSNLPPGELSARYDERIASRIDDTCKLIVLENVIRKPMETSPPSADNFT